MKRIARRDSSCTDRLDELEGEGADDLGYDEDYDEDEYPEEDDQEFDEEEDF